MPVLPVAPSVLAVMRQNMTTTVTGFLDISIFRRGLNGISAGVTNNSSTGSTASLLSSQWTNPRDVLSVLLIIGGDIVQKALAQTSGGLFTPVCFSFGWVAYSFTALVGIVGGGRLLPEPDFPVKIYNLKNGYVRENKNWIIGRILRDNEMHMSKKYPLNGVGLRISIYEAQPCATTAAVAGSGKTRLITICVIALQHGIAALPVGLYKEWGVLMITAAGTVLAQLAGVLPQWKAEKLPNHRKSHKNFALTSGNGARDIMIVLGDGHSLDLEELAAAETSRSTRIWDTVPSLSREVTENMVPERYSNGVPMRTAISDRGIPRGFWITIVVSVVQSVLWLALLITVAGLRSHTWYLLLVGGIGMFQNAAVAACSRNPEKRNLPLLHDTTIIASKVMDGLMDLEVKYPNTGRRLLAEFCPGELYPDESNWWKGNTAGYDKKREAEKVWRGTPWSLQPRYVRTVPNDAPETEKVRKPPDMVPSYLPTRATSILKPAISRHQHQIVAFEETSPGLGAELGEGTFRSPQSEDNVPSGIVRNDKSYKIYSTPSWAG